ncbi:MAG: DUF6364 family protein [Bacteroidales bacterium]|jgi:hypothetical protein|nr:DUF6364 family protein [Bacteroidales bacterium]
METRLTITIDSEIVSMARKSAQSQKSNLPDLIKTYLISLSKDTMSANNIELTPIVKSLKGSFKNSEISDYKKELRTRVSNKYL